MPLFLILFIVVLLSDITTPSSSLVNLPVIESVCPIKFNTPLLSTFVNVVSFDVVTVPVLVNNVITVLPDVFTVNVLVRLFMSEVPSVLRAPLLFITDNFLYSDKNIIPAITNVIPSAIGPACKTPYIPLLNAIQRLPGQITVLY